MQNDADWTVEVDVDMVRTNGEKMLLVVGPVKSKSKMTMEHLMTKMLINGVGVKTGGVGVTTTLLQVLINL